MTKELILRILINVHNQEEADNAFQYIHNHWMLTTLRPDLYTPFETYRNLLRLIKSNLDRSDDTRISKWLENWKKEQM